MQKFLLVLSVLAVVALGVLELTFKGIEPDVVYEMSNKHIEWQYAGK